MKKYLLCFLFIILGLINLNDPTAVQQSVSLNKKQEIHTEYDAEKAKLMAYLIFDRDMSFRESVWWSHNIVSASRSKGIDTKLYASLVDVESSFDAKAVSPKGAIGPAQIMPDSWSHMGNLHNPKENIKIGANILSIYIKMCNGNIKCGLMNYNIGDGNYKNGVHLESGRQYFSKVVSSPMMLL